MFMYSDLMLNVPMGDVSEELAYFRARQRFPFSQTVLEKLSKKKTDHFLTISHDSKENSENEENNNCDKSFEIIELDE